VLPGVGPYIADALAAQVHDADAVGVDTNIRRVAERTAGITLRDADAADHARSLAPGLGGRDRFLALMDVGATVCTARAPRCGECPLHAVCATRGVRDGEARRRQARYEGSLRQRRGGVLARLRDQASAPVHELDAEALAGLQADGLVEVHRGRARLART
jgi:A/G-specific adenine glycosylase